MKFLVGFLVAFFVIVGSVGVAIAQSSEGGGGGSCSCSLSSNPLDPQLSNSSVGVEWQREIDLEKANSQRRYQPLFYMNPAAREAAIRVYNGNPDIPVFHADWYAGNPRYFSEIQWQEYRAGGGY